MNGGQGMSDLKEAWERDLDWLTEHFGRHDENEAEEFCERVAILVSEGKSEAEARDQAMSFLKDKRKT